MLPSPPPMVAATPSTVEVRISERSQKALERIAEAIPNHEEGLGAFGSTIDQLHPDFRALAKQLEALVITLERQQTVREQAKTHANFFALLAQVNHLIAILERPTAGEPAKTQETTGSETESEAGRIAALTRAGLAVLDSLSQGGRQSPVARVAALREWLKEKAALEAWPLESADDRWLLVAISVPRQPEAMVVPALNTVIGPGPLSAWFECYGCDGATPLGRNDVITLAQAWRELSNDHWRLMKKGLVRRDAA